MGRPRSGDTDAPNHNYYRLTIYLPFMTVFKPAPRHEVSLGATPARMALLAGLGLALGVVGGLAAYLVVKLVALISNLALLHRVGFSLPSLSHYNPGPELIPVAVLGALIVVALSLWTPIIKGHGIPESLETIVLRESRIRPRVVIAKPLSAAIAMGTGGPFGAEGPIIVTGGSIGSLLGQILPGTAAERRILLATGAAAGMAGVFATPIAAVIMAFELLLFERSLRSLLPLSIACAVATEIHYLTLGAEPLFHAPGIHTPGGLQLPLFVVLGVAAGLLAVVINKGLFAWEGIFRGSRLPELWHPVAGALGFALVGLAVPGSLSVGYWAITDAVNGRFLAGAALALAGAKLLSWWIALASNTSGGTLAPIFLIASALGDAMGIGFAHLFPSLHIQPGAFALVAMGATFGASARALLTGGVFALEVTGAAHLVVPMLLCLGVAELVAGWMLPERIMTDKLVRRGFRVEFDTQVDPFRTAVAAQVMEPLVEVPEGDALPIVGPTSYLQDVLDCFLNTGAEKVVVIDGETPVGVLSRSALKDALARRLYENEPQPPTLHPGKAIGRLLQRFSTSEAAKEIAGDFPEGEVAE